MLPVKEFAATGVETGSTADAKEYRSAIQSPKTIQESTALVLQGLPS